MRRLLLICVSSLGILACGEKKAAVEEPSQAQPADQTSLNSNQKAAALKQIIAEGSEYSLNLLTIKGGLNKNAVYRIPMPKGIAERQEKLASLGLKKEPGELHNLLNEAGERTLDSCGKLLSKILAAVTYENPDELITNGNGAITFYTELQTTKNIKTRLLPVVEFYLDTLGATSIYQNILNTWNAQRKPGDGGINTNLVEHTLERTLIAYFGYIKIKENNLRAQPQLSKSQTVTRVLSEMRNN